MTDKGRRGFFGSLLSGAASLKDGLVAARDEEEGADSEPEGPTFIPPPATEPPARARPAPRGPRRPPGALAEADFLTTCTRCGDCIAVCPEETLAIGPDHYPVARVERFPCALCPTTPCITACGPGALSPTPPAAFRFGTARVMARLCLNHASPTDRSAQGPTADAEAVDTDDSGDPGPCERCLDWCPIPGALVLADASRSQVPTVNPDLCTGCGLCVAHCPAYPRAIELR